MSKNYPCIKQVLFYLIIIVYIFLLAKILLFKYVTPFEVFNTERIVTRSYNLIPFKTINQYLSNNFNILIALLNVVGNIIIFIPLGIYLLVFMKSKNILKHVALVCAISLCVEIAQYILGIGAADIDDIILNTIGGLMGVLLYKGIYLLAKDENKVKTTIIFLWGISCVCTLIFMFFITFFTGFKIKLF